MNLIPFVTAALLTFSTFASESSTLNLKSASGITFEISYKKTTEVLQSNKPITNTLIKDLNVVAKGIAPKSSVQAVIVLKGSSSVLCSSSANVYQKTMKLDLNYDSSSNTFSGFYPTYGYFYGEYGMVSPVHKVGLDQLKIKSSGECLNETAIVEFAVVVDGVWQQDSLTGKNNFTLNF